MSLVAQLCELLRKIRRLKDQVVREAFHRMFERCLEEHHDVKYSIEKQYSSIEPLIQCVARQGPTKAQAELVLEGISQKSVIAVKENKRLFKKWKEGGRSDIHDNKIKSLEEVDY